METKRISEEQKAQLHQPLPSEAVTPHPTKKFLSSIKSIYVTERLNDVFGCGAWRVETDFIDRQDKMIVVKVKFTAPDYGIEYECFGGNDNADLGDAYKGATTDALTKIGSWLGIGQEVFKGEAGKPKPSPITTPTRKTLTIDKLMDSEFSERLIKWLHDRKGNKSIEEVVVDYYECDKQTLNAISNEYNRTYNG